MLQHRRHIVWLADTADRVQGQRGLQGRLAAGDSRRQGRPHEARGHRVHPDPTARVGRGGRAHQAFEARLGRGDGLVVRQADGGGRGGDERDADRGPMLRHHRPHQPERRGEIQLQRPLPLLVARQVQRLEHDRTDAVGHAVDAPMALEHARDQRVHGRGQRDVGRHGFGADLVGPRLQSGRVPRRHDDVTALRAQAPHQRLADAPTPPGHQHHRHRAVRIHHGHSGIGRAAGTGGSGLRAQGAGLTTHGSRLTAEGGRAKGEGRRAKEEGGRGNEGAG